jgi:diguanylate cyclase (GGDEF)-like protein/PAS domain S-box-containing protein
MSDDEKSRRELLEELAALRRLVIELETMQENHRRLEEALRESEERFRFMAEATGEALYQLRYDSMKYDYMSPSISKLTGYSPVEIDTVGFKNLIEGIEDLRKTNLSMEAIERNRHAGETGEYHADYQIQTKSGEQKWLGDHSFPWLDRTGKPIGSVGILSDITKRKEMEADLLEANRKLELANKKLDRLATLDGLTRVANRRKLDRFLDLEWRHTKREQLPIAFILCDIDHFKLYNDTYGHQAGDDCLRAVARAIKECVKRPRDLVARYGGEEFAVVLPSTNSGGAVHIAESICEEVRNLRIPHSQSSTGEFLTMSCGVASVIPNEGSSPESLVAVADEGLYEAKKQGRNRIVVKTQAQ